MSSAAPIVTIDGPVGSGKGTIASRLASRLGWHFLDSGVLYRLVALRALQEGVSEPSEVVPLAAALPARFEFSGGVSRIFLADDEVTRDIRREDVSSLASRLAVIPEVRAALVERQRAFHRSPGLVADGRDMGTVIFPAADLKIYLTATAEARAMRRYKQLKEKGESVNLSRLFREVVRRDTRDSNRKVAPLRPAQDAVVIDSTDMDINEVVERISKLVEEKIINN